MLRSLLCLTFTFALVAATAAQEPLPRPKDGVPPPVVNVPPPGPVTAMQQPMVIPTHRQFAEALKPCCGKYRVLVIHPCTCQPVEICFELPDRCAKCVKASKDEIEVRYGLLSYVKIRFCKGGDVKVKTGCCTYACS